MATHGEKMLKYGGAGVSLTPGTIKAGNAIVENLNLPTYIRELLRFIKFGAGFFNDQGLTFDLWIENFTLDEQFIIEP